jgi:peptidylprolyl isomerase
LPLPAAANGLKVFDLVEGRGEAVATGTRVVVHYDCMYRGIDVVSSRQARLLGGNRTIAEPFEFVAGGKLDSSRVRVDADSAGGLFSGASGPKPPPALSTAVVGMKLGGKVRRVPSAHRRAALCELVASPPRVAALMPPWHPTLQRSVMVPPELGYGAVGEQEIGPNTPLFELKIELLSVEP